MPDLITRPKFRDREPNGLTLAPSGHAGGARESSDISALLNRRDKLRVNRRADISGPTAQAWQNCFCPSPLSLIDIRGIDSRLRTWTRACGRGQNLARVVNFCARLVQETPVVRLENVAASLLE